MTFSIFLWKYVFFLYIYISILQLVGRMVGGIQDLEVESSSDEDEEDDEDEEEPGPQSRKAASNKSSGVFSMFK